MCNGKSKQDFERLKAQRKGYRGVVNRQIDVANYLVSNFSEISTNRLRTIATSLKDKRAILDDCNKQIMLLIDVDQIESEIEESDEIDQNIANTIELIKCHFEQQLHDLAAQTSQLQILNSPQFNISQPNNRDQGNDSSRGNSNSPTSTSGQHNNYFSHVNTDLPRINLPKFSGDYKKFNQFWDSFDSLVHTNEKLSNIDKFNYLNGALEPKSRAARAIEGLTITNYNYQSACELLKEQFDTTQRKITATMDDLLKLPSVTKTGGASELRYFYDRMCAIVRGLDLEALDITSTGHGCFFIPVIMTKLPDDVRVQLEQITSKDVWEFPEVLAAIKTELQAREMSEVKTQLRSTVALKFIDKKLIQTTEPFMKSEVETQWSTIASKLVQTTEPFMIVRNTTPSQEHCKTQCVYCKSNHNSESCEQVEDYVTRKNICKINDRCYICLEKGHQATKCKSSKRCCKCTGNHHQSLCDALLKNTSPVPVPQCVYCKSHHFSGQCTQFKDVATRKQICNRDHRCYVCFEKGHQAPKCTSSKRCSLCGGKHQRSLCDAVKDTPKGQCKTLCVYCKANHFSASCEQVKDVATRIQILKQANRCALCLQMGHQVPKCESFKLCKWCNGKHHTSLCNLY